MRALWSAASGMKGIQAQIDTIANNLANVNTTGFKKQRLEFKDMLYQKMSQPNFNQGEGKPIGVELGNGVMVVGTSRSFVGGTPNSTQNDLDLAIVGEGFLSVRDGQNNIRYTRDGSLKLSVGEGSTKLVTAIGDVIQGSNGDMELGEDVRSISIDKSGNVLVTRRSAPEVKESVGKINISRFANPEGLESIGENKYVETPASGIATLAEKAENGEVWQGYLESSNVQVADEMVNMITAQRAYELNVKTIQTADRMLELANQVKG